MLNKSNQSVSARFPLATKAFSYLQPTFKTKFSFDPFSDEHKLYYDSDGDYDEYKTEAEAEKIFDKNLALAKYALFLSVLPTQQEQPEVSLEVAAVAVEVPSYVSKTKAPIKEKIDLKAVSERLKPRQQNGCMIFTGAKSLSDRAFTKKYYSKKKLERHDSFFNTGLCVGYKTSDGISKNGKLKSLEGKIYTELTKNAKRKTQVPEKKELISSVVANLVDLHIKNEADYICMDRYKDRLGKLNEKKAGIPIDTNSQYLQNKPIPRFINDIVDLMEKMGLLKKITGHMSLENETGNKTRICAAGELKQIMEDIPEDKLKKLITNVADEQIKLKKNFENKGVGNTIRACIDYENTDLTNSKEENSERN